MTLIHRISPNATGSIGLTIEGTAPVVISSVVAGGAADKAGIRNGDRIFEIGGQLP